VNVGAPPLSVNSDGKVANLNADLLDGYDYSSFLQLGVAHSLNAGSRGVVDVTNTNFGPGVRGTAQDPTASGVYGQNLNGDSHSYGVYGRAVGNGTGVAGYNTGTGYAGRFFGKVYLGGNLECTGCVTPGDISTEFVQGAGKAAGQAIAEAPGKTNILGPALLGFLHLSYACPSTLSNNGKLLIYNDSGSAANIFVEDGGANPTYYQIAAGASVVRPASATGDSFHIQAQGALGVMTIEVATVHRANDCHAQAQALLTS
jgi:hypothetical protein